MKTNNIIQKWRKFVNEVVDKPYNHYQADLILRYDEDISLYGDIFNQIRAIEGVTIISVTTKSKTSGIDQKMVRLELKYIPTKKQVPLSQQGFLLKRLIKKIYGVDDARILSSKKIHK